MQAIREKVMQAAEFTKTDVWRVRPETLPWWKSIGVRLIRIAILTVQEFQRNYCFLRASALTFFTVLSLVPVAAMAFGIAQGFGFERMLENWLYSNFPGQDEVVTRVIEFAHSMLDNTQGGLIAGIGIIALFWAVIKVLGQIEMSMNAIWRVETPRTFIRKITDYLTIMMIAPILVIVSGSVTVYIKTQIINIIHHVSLLGAFSPIIFFGLRLIPYILIWALFTMIYIVMPNTVISPVSGLIAGITAGTIYQLVQWVYINFQIGVASYNAIYGSFAALPLFLVWLQISWLIVLLGASISAAHQRSGSFGYIAEGTLPPVEYQRISLLRICHMVIRRFIEDEPPLTAKEISDMLDISEGDVTKLLERMERQGLMAAVRVPGGDGMAWQPGRNPDTIRVKTVLDALEKNRGVGFLAEPDTPLHSIHEILQQFDEAVASSPANRLLKEL